MKKMKHDVRTLLRKPAVGMIAAVTAITSMAPLSNTMQASAFGTDELAGKLRAIEQMQESLKAERQQLIEDYNNNTGTVPSEPVKFKALFVKCNDITMMETRTVDGEETTVPVRYVIGHGSDTDKVIDHGIARFEETVEDTTSHVLDIVPTTIWVDDPVTIEINGFGYNELKDTISEPIPVEEYDSVFFFNAREGVYSTTGRGVKDEYGESYIQTVCVRDEIQRIKDGLSVEEERKALWTCGNMTHEWIHQLDLSSKSFVGDALFPLCHDYVVEGGGFEDLLQTEENGDVYLTHPTNGYKWKYVEGKYPDHLGDYYEAFLAGEIIDTNDGNKKKGMTPMLWKYIRDYRDCKQNIGELGTYMFQNTKTGNFLQAEDVKDRFGAQKMTTVAADDLFSDNLQWKLEYDMSQNHSGTVQISPKIAPNELVRSEDGASVDTVALYEKGWGTAELDNKNFSFKIVRTDDGNYQIKSTLSAFADYNLCENPDGSVELRQDDETGTWKLTKVGVTRGDYCIRNLGKRGALTLNGTEAEIQPYAFENGLTGQEWSIRAYQDGLYTISANSDDLCFTVKGSKAAAGCLVSLTPCNDTPYDTQLWYIQQDADGFYRIISKADPALYLTWTEDEKIHGLTVGINEDSAAQIWDLGQPEKYSRINEGYYCLKTADGKYLSANDTKKDDPKLIKSENPFYWNITDKGNGYYWIKAMADGDNKYLDTAFSVNQEGTTIQLCTDTSVCGDPEGASYAQQWAFEMNADGTYHLMPKLTFARGLRLENDSYDTVAYLSSLPDSFTLVQVQKEDVVIMESKIKGDANSDYAVDVADAVLVARFCAEDSEASITRQGLKNADVNHSGQADSDDTIQILKFIARLITSFD